MHDYASTGFPIFKEPAKALETKPSECPQNQGTVYFGISAYPEIEEDERDF